MKKTAVRPCSRYTRDAAALLGGLIREARKKRQLTLQEVADRAGVSRGLLQRIEKGDPRCAIGAVFEAAAIVGVKLFDADEQSVAEHLRHTREKLELLPKSIRQKSRPVRDDF